MPSLIRRHNLDMISVDTQKCEQVVHGNQYLILAAVTGLANVLGRPIGFLLRSHVKFAVLQTAFMLGVAISYGTILTKPGLLIESIMMGIGKLCYSMQGAEETILLWDVEYFGVAGLLLGSALSNTTGQLGAVISTSLAVFIDPYTAVLVTLVVVLAQIALIWMMTERH